MLRPIEKDFELVKCEKGEEDVYLALKLDEESGIDFQSRPHNGNYDYLAELRLIDIQTCIIKYSITLEVEEETYCELSKLLDSPNKENIKAFLNPFLEHSGKGFNVIYRYTYKK